MVMKFASSFSFICTCTVSMPAHVNIIITHKYCCQVEVLVGPANEGIAELAARGVRFDLAFLDADKTGYLGYYRQLMDGNLLLPGGAVIVDNTLMKV